MLIGWVRTPFHFQTQDLVRLRSYLHPLIEPPAGHPDDLPGRLNQGNPGTPQARDSGIQHKLSYLLLLAQPQGLKPIASPAGSDF